MIEDEQQVLVRALDAATNPVLITERSGCDCVDQPSVQPVEWLFEAGSWLVKPRTFCRRDGKPPRSIGNCG